MVGIVIATHGPLAQGFLDSVNMIMGSTEKLSIAILKNDIGITLYKEELKNSINSVMSENGVLIMTDIQGGSPYNTSCYFQQSGDFLNNIKIISGINLPMLLEVLAMRDSCSIDKLVEIAVNSGREGINVKETTIYSNNCDEEL